MTVLIDTNVVIDFLLAREPFNEYADRIFDMCSTKTINGFISAQSFSDLFFILRKGRTTDERRAMLIYICNFLDIVGLDKLNICNALLRFDFADFEDCLQAGCAAECGADYIITRNVKDFLQSGVKAVTPEDFLKLIDKR